MDLNALFVQGEGVYVTPFGIRRDQLRCPLKLKESTEWVGKEGSWKYQS